MGRHDLERERAPCGKGDEADEIVVHVHHPPPVSELLLQRLLKDGDAVLSIKAERAVLAALHRLGHDGEADELRVRVEDRRPASRALVLEVCEGRPMLGVSRAVNESSLEYVAERANERTNKRANERTSEPANERTNEQSKKQRLTQEVADAVVLGRDLRAPVAPSTEQHFGPLDPVQSERDVVLGRLHDHIVIASRVLAQVEDQPVVVVVVVSPSSFRPPKLHHLHRRVLVAYHPQGPVAILPRERVERRASSILVPKTKGAVWLVARLPRRLFRRREVGGLALRGVGLREHTKCRSVGIEKERSSSVGANPLQHACNHTHRPGGSSRRKDNPVSGHRGLAKVASLPRDKGGAPSPPRFAPPRSGLNTEPPCHTVESECRHQDSRLRPSSPLGMQRFTLSCFLSSLAQQKGGAGLKYGFTFEVFHTFSFFPLRSTPNMAAKRDVARRKGQASQAPKAREGVSWKGKRGKGMLASPCGDEHEWKQWTEYVGHCIKYRCKRFASRPETPTVRGRGTETH